MTTKRLRRKIGVKKRKKTVKRKNKGVKTRKNRKNCKLIGGNDDCPICLNEIDSNMVTTECKHSFCKNCLINVCKMSKDPQCPMCRGDIKDTCKKILPFDSREVFQHTFISGADDKRRKNSIEKINEIVYNKNFDVNVKNQLGLSVLWVLSYNQSDSLYFKNIIEYLLKNKKIIVDNDIIIHLIANNNTHILALYKKHNKIPKHLKKLIN
jgi:hypothetical protein